MALFPQYNPWPLCAVSFPFRYSHSLWPIKQELKHVCRIDLVRTLDGILDTTLLVGILLH
jgi:hypothetical protein